MAQDGREAIVHNARQTIFGRSALFRGIGSAVSVKILKAAQHRHLARGARLANEGARADFVHLIVSGSVKLAAAGNEGSAIALKFVRAGDAIGEASALAGAPYVFTAIAMSKGECLSWTAATFEQLAQEVRQLALNCLALAVRSEQRMVRRICATLTDDVERRIAGALIELTAIECESRSSDLLQIGGREIAEISGTTIYTVSRVIAAWKRAGIVAGGRGRITVIDLNRLAQITRAKIDRERGLA
jgi:CRP-like cAMP-binding protein